MESIFSQATTTPKQTLQKLETNKCQQAADMHIKLVRHILYLYQPSLSGHHQLELTDGLVRWSYLISVALLLSKLSRAAQSSAVSQTVSHQPTGKVTPVLLKFQNKTSSRRRIYQLKRNKLDEHTVDVNL